LSETSLQPHAFFCLLHLPFTRALLIRPSFSASCLGFVDGRSVTSYCFRFYVFHQTWLLAERSDPYSLPRLVMFFVVSVWLVTDLWLVCYVFGRSRLHFSSGYFASPPFPTYAVIAASYGSSLPLLSGGVCYGRRPSQI